MSADPNEEVAELSSEGCSVVFEVVGVDFMGLRSSALLVGNHLEKRSRISNGTVGFRSSSSPGFFSFLNQRLLRFIVFESGHDARLWFGRKWAASSRSYITTDFFVGMQTQHVRAFCFHFFNFETCLLPRKVTTAKLCRLHERVV